MQSEFLVPTSSFPELHELIWLFESEPTIPEEYPGWPIIPPTFETERGPWRVRCEIAPYDYTVTIRCWSIGRPTRRVGSGGMLPTFHIAPDDAELVALGITEGHPAGAISVAPVGERCGAEGNHPIDLVVASPIGGH